MADEGETVDQYELTDLAELQHLPAAVCELIEAYRLVICIACGINALVEDTFDCDIEGCAHPYCTGCLDYCEGCSIAYCLNHGIECADCGDERNCPRCTVCCRECQRSMCCFCFYESWHMDRCYSNGMPRW